MKQVNIAIAILEKLTFNLLGSGNIIPFVLRGWNPLSSEIRGFPLLSLNKSIKKPSNIKCKKNAWEKAVLQKNRTKKSNGNEIFGMAPKLILSAVLPSEFKMSAGTWIFSFPFKNYFYVHKNVKELISAKFWYKENVKYGCKQKKYSNHWIQKHVQYFPSGTD